MYYIFRIKVFFQKIRTLDLLKILKLSKNLYEIYFQLYPNIEFYGSDPSSIVNKDLYENKLGGKFYKYAISGERGMKNSRVFQGL